MGHREQLMAGAKRCLQERGYARTTSRDLAAAAGAPLGSINYHYGSKEGLLNAALMETVMEWGDKAVATAADDGGAERADALGRLREMWEQVIAANSSHRPMLVSTVEAFAQAERSPEVRQQIADAMERSRPRMAAELHGIDAEADPQLARAVGSVHMALVAGLSQQWLVDPEHAPSAQDVAAGLRAIAESITARAE